LRGKIIPADEIPLLIKRSLADMKMMRLAAMSTIWE
jgi:hypothetical protein